MTSRRLALAVLLAGVTGAACGNYSNEDLEFMAAVPTTTELAVELPSAIDTAAEAELAKKTHDAIATVNDSLKSVLGLVEAIRSYTPTSRTDDSRTWGPFPDANNPGWQWELIVSRDPITPTTFNYALQVRTDATSGSPAGAWLPFVTGTFDAAEGSRQGTGTVSANFGTLSDNGFPLGSDTMNLSDLTISYRNFDTAGSPVEVSMTIDSRPSSGTSISSISIVYEILTDQSGEMAFTLTGDLVPGPAGAEVVQVNSQWLPGGAGAATLKVASGDGTGLAQTECWDSAFAPTYNDKPWAASEDTGASSACPMLPNLPPLAP